jgi:hypothetical protein
MDVINKIAGRHFNYHCKGGFSCTCPGCAGPTRTRIAEMISRVDRQDSHNREHNRADLRTRNDARRASKIKSSLIRRAKRKVERFAMKEAREEV